MLHLLWLSKYSTIVLVRQMQDQAEAREKPTFPHGLKLGGLRRADFCQCLRLFLFVHLGIIESLTAPNELPQLEPDSLFLFDILW